MFWEEQRSLIVSDLHFGKTGHFRKSGVAVPPAVYKEDLHRLMDQIQYFRPDRLIIVGDLFHSEANLELELFKRWREQLGEMVIELVRGNHDILHHGWYREAAIRMHQESLLIGEFGFIHDISLSENLDSLKDSYLFSGHVHPGIRIEGMARQSLCFPCFYFGKNYAVLPAFSKFTGVALIQPEVGENVFALVPSDQRRRQAGSIIQIQ
jgi:DNA ligase-associated metallophosphoesterase